MASKPEDTQSLWQDYRKTGDKALRERLTHLSNLGLALQAVGDLDGAEDALRRGVDGRRSFYGPGHAGYGFGLEPLGEPGDTL